MTKKKELTQKEKDLIKKYENPSKAPKKSMKEDYLKETDRNYKDGDRN